MKDLNLRPLACEASALTTELIARRPESLRSSCFRSLEEGSFASLGITAVKLPLFFVTEGWANCKQWRIQQRM
jgi:hypothetical protein